MNSKIAGENHQAKSYGRGGGIVHHIWERGNIIIVTKHFAFSVSFWKFFFLWSIFGGGEEDNKNIHFHLKKKKKLKEYA